MTDKPDDILPDNSARFSCLHCGIVFANMAAVLNHVTETRHGFKTAPQVADDQATDKAE